MKERPLFCFNNVRTPEVILNMNKVISNSRLHQRFLTKYSHIYLCTQHTCVLHIVDNYEQWHLSGQEITSLSSLPCQQQCALWRFMVSITAYRFSHSFFTLCKKNKHNCCFLSILNCHFRTCARDYHALKGFWNVIINTVVPCILFQSLCCC